MTMKEALDRAVEEQYTTPDGLVDFGKMVDEDPHMAELWLATHVLPKLQEGQYTDIPNIPREIAERRQQEWVLKLLIVELLLRILFFLLLVHLIQLIVKFNYK